MGRKGLVIAPLDFAAAFFFRAMGKVETMVLVVPQFEMFCGRLWRVSRGWRLLSAGLCR